AFWVSWLAIGLLVFGSYLWAMIFAEIHTARYFTYWPSGPWYTSPIPESPVWALWIDYTALASYCLGRQPQGTFIVAWSNHPADSVTYALIILMPHVLLGAAGGSLGLWLAKRGSERGESYRVSTQIGTG